MSPEFTPERSDAIREQLIEHVAHRKPVASVAPTSPEMPTQSDLDGVGTLRRRRPSHGQWIAVGVALILVAGIVGGTVVAELTNQSPVVDASGDPSASDPASALGAADVYAGSGIVIERGGVVQLCLGGHYQSFPPICLATAATLSGWDWSVAPANSVVDGVRFTEESVTVYGSVTTAAQGEPPTLDVTGTLAEEVTAGPATRGSGSIRSGLSNAELQAVIAELTATIGPHGASIVDGVILTTVAFDNGALQQAVDEKFGRGVVVVESLLQRY